MRLRSRIRYSPFEYSKGSGTGGTPHATDSDGNRNIFAVDHDNDELWLNGNNGHPENFWNSDNRFVFLRRNYLRFSPGFPGEFCFCSCPIHPPIIRPTSSIGSESRAYFSLSMDLVSQSTIRRIFSASVFRAARRTYGIFSSLERKVAAETASMISMKIWSILWPSEYLWSLGSI